MAEYTTTNPTTGRTDKEFTTLDSAQVERVLDRSHAAFAEWRATAAKERASILERVADAYDDRSRELGELIAVEMGKPLQQAIGEAELAGSIYRWYATHGPDLLQPEQLDPQGAQESLVQTEPIGPLVGVMPWNYPYYQVARFAAPNLMAGNTIILKHAEICAGSSEVMAQILHEAGVPRDAYANVFASHDQIADMIADPRVRGVSLTGSEKAGAAVAENAGKHLKKSVLELGGSDPLIVLDDADLEQVARTVATARLSNAGQACNSPKRIFVPAARREEFVAIVVESFEDATVGDPLDEEVDVGPLSSVGARDGVVAQVERAVEQGATLHTGRPGSRARGCLHAARRAHRCHPGYGRLRRGDLRPGRRDPRGRLGGRSGEAGQRRRLRSERLRLGHAISNAPGISPTVSTSGWPTSTSTGRRCPACPSAA